MFYAANMDLASATPPIDLFRQWAPIFTRPRFLPGTRLSSVKLNETIVCEGCDITAERIDRSIIGIRSMIGSGVRLSRVVMMGADHYDDSVGNRIPIGIGKNSVIEGAIIDKNARIGRDTVIRNVSNIQEFDGPGYFIRDGIVIIPKNGVIPPGTVI